MVDRHAWRAAWMIMVACVAVVLPRTAAAHKPSDSYIRVTPVDGLMQVQWDIALKDLELLIGLDVDGDRQISWGEVKSKGFAIAAHAASKLDLIADGEPVNLTAKDLLFDRHSDGGYAVLVFETDCPATIQEMQIDYRLLFPIDPTHRGLVRFDGNEGQSAAIIGPDDSPITLSTRSSTFAQSALKFVEEGVYHIWIGADHILFLVVLLLPSVLVRRRQQWRPAKSSKSAIRQVVKIVSVFTLAHSITLWIAVTETYAPPSRWVESLIALSIVITAVDNVYQRLQIAPWGYAFGFGLIHGFGFAGVLGDLGLTDQTLLASLLGFNIGVELGQLAIVAAIMPVLLALRHRPWYPTHLLRWGSFAAAALALFWFVQRAFNLA